MERRVLIAVLLSFVVLYGYQAMFPPPPVPKPAQTTTSKAATAPTASGSTQSNPAASVQGAPAAATAEAVTPSTPAQEIEIDNADVHAVFTTRGAVLKSWQLKKYRDESNHPLEMIAGHAPADSPLPFTLAVDDPAVSGKLAAAPFTVAPSAAASAAGWQAQFDYQDATGLRAQKIFTIAPDKPYVINVTASVWVNGTQVPATLRWGPALGSGITVKSRTYNPPPQPIFFKDGKVSRIAPAKIAEQPVVEGTFGFAGVDDHYFLVAVVKPNTPVRLDYSPVDVQLETHPEGAHYVSWAARLPAAPQAVAYFAGPKDFDVLAKVDPGLVRAIDFGMFSFLVVPLLRALKWLNIYVGNYGWSLILLTVLINLAMFPLRHKSVVSMRKMQEVQPEVKAIQDRYENMKLSDPARGKMNTELMALYKERGVNPASGCVPMLLTLPVLFAFYSMLSVAIELRGAPFIGQIHDLSAHDPLFIWPVVMGITMFVQQKMTPSTADPMQQKMMMFMPIMMTGMFLWAASGLVIYWTVSNTWGIAQQMITNRLIGPPAQRTVRPPAERRMKNVKNVGGGKTDQAAKDKDKERQ
jgi:YidC/Oxa1 family membrane protein insertase